MNYTNFGMLDKRKRTPWFKWNEQPVQKGFYECGVLLGRRFSDMVVIQIEFDGQRWKVPDMVIMKIWRGLANKPK